LEPLFPRAAQKRHLTLPLRLCMKIANLYSQNGPEVYTQRLQKRGLHAEPCRKTTMD
jgi:hypothetical protein